MKCTQSDVMRYNALCKGPKPLIFCGECNNFLALGALILGGGGDLKYFTSPNISSYASHAEKCSYIKSLTCHANQMSNIYAKC